jgi:hypothetical protein
MKSRRPRKWQARFRNWIGSSKYGLICVGVRRNSRGVWINPGDAPADVQFFLTLSKTPGAGYWCCDEFHSSKEMLDLAENCERRQWRGGIDVAFSVVEG